jgi:hypothetical protein
VTAVNDAEAFEHYNDPAKPEPAAGAPRRRFDQPLAQHVPVRFPRETIQQAKRLADADGVTVSTWIRRAVHETLRRRDAFGGKRTSR